MFLHRPAGERGHANFGWLDSHHSFSFGQYHDPKHMGFRVLRVINEDRVAPGKGFGTHSHRDMEILTYVISGGLQHKDSLGTGEVIHPGDVQRMTAGSGVSHSEFNASSTEGVHFLQIWVLPEAAGLTPSYAQKHYSDQEKTGTLRLLASRGGRDGSVHWNQKVDLYASKWAESQTLLHPLAAGRHAWIQVIHGALSVNDRPLAAGDGLAVSGEPELHLKGTPGAEILLFDLP